MRGAAGEKARANVVEDALVLAGEAVSDARELPELPAECRKKEAAGVAAGDRLDVAALKLGRALNRANDRSAFCSAWFDQVRESRANN